MTEPYRVRAIWDAEAGVFFAESDIPGLNIEAATLPEFIEVVRDLAPELIAANCRGHNPAARSIHLEADLDLTVA